MLTKLSFHPFPLLLLAATTCHHNPGNNSQSHTLPDHADKVIAAQDHFAFKLFKTILGKDNTSSNKLISPLSVYLDLSMAYNGTAGETQLKMQHALQLNKINTALLNTTNGALIYHLSATDPAVDINIANSIWYRNQGYQPLPSFLKINSAYYHAKITSADFNNSGTVNEINHWASTQTHKKIKTIVEQINPADTMYLINAVYFNGKWKNAFDTNRLDRKIFFHITGNDSVKTKFMFKRAKFNYMKNASLQMIELPYGKGDFNMYVLLPSKKSDLQNLIATLNENSFDRYMSSLDSVVVDLRLPSWEYRYKTDMEPGLTDLGMGIVFTRQADFSNMYESNAKAHISKVIQKTYIKVNEQGTEAAAVTSTVVVVGYSGHVHFKPPPVMDVNRPFLYVIAERNSSVILFIGEVNNPAED